MEPINETTERFAVPTPPTGKPSWIPQWPAWVGTVVVFLVVVAVVVNLVWFSLAHPEQSSDLVEAVVVLAAFVTLFHHSDRIRKLEKRQAPVTGPLELMIADAKAAAKLAGNSEAQAQAIANEVLSTTVRHAGGWRATP